MHIAMKRSNLNARKLDFEEELIIILISALSGTEDNAESNSLAVGLVIYWLYQPGLCRWISIFSLLNRQTGDLHHAPIIY